jgi:hypothetical protein
VRLDGLRHRHDPSRLRRSRPARPGAQLDGRAELELSRRPSGIRGHEDPQEDRAEDDRVDSAARAPHRSRCDQPGGHPRPHRRGSLRLPQGRRQPGHAGVPPGPLAPRGQHPVERSPALGAQHHLAPAPAAPGADPGLGAAEQRPGPLRSQRRAAPASRLLRRLRPELQPDRARVEPRRRSGRARAEGGLPRPRALRGAAVVAARQADPHLGQDRALPQHRPVESPGRRALVPAQPGREPALAVDRPGGLVLLRRGGLQGRSARAGRRSG